MPAEAHRQHKFAKGETLAGIARRYGHADAKAVWGFAANKALVGKRRKPEALEPGDLIAIPPTAQELKERQQRAAFFEKAIAAEWALDADLAAAGRRAAQRIGLLADAEAAFDRLESEVAATVEGLLKELPASADAVQAARRVVQAGAAVQAACKTGSAALRSCATKSAATRTDVASAIGKGLALGGTGELVQLDAQTTQEERVADELLAGLAAPWADLQRSAWWAGHALALRDLPAWAPGAADGVAAAIADALKQAHRASAALRRDLGGCLRRAHALPRGLETMRKMAEMRRLQAGQQRAGPA